MTTESDIRELYNKIRRLGRTVAGVVEIDHNNLNGLQGGQAAEYYHLNATEHPYISGANAQSLLNTASPQFAGLTLTGELIVTNIQFTTGIIDRNTDAGELKFRSSATDEKGASVKLYGASHGSFPGNIYLDFGDFTAAAPAGATLNVRAFDNGGAITVLKCDISGHLHVWDWDDGALREVDFGIDDSGGTGFKVLRVPN